jgi:hypothetical protein
VQGDGFTIHNESSLLATVRAGNTQDMLRAAFIASQMGCQSVMFETDSTVLKQAVTTEEFDMSMSGAIFLRY